MTKYVHALPESIVSASVQQIKAFCEAVYNQSRRIVSENIELTEFINDKLDFHEATQPNPHKHFNGSRADHHAWLMSQVPATAAKVAAQPRAWFFDSGDICGVSFSPDAGTGGVVMVYKAAPMQPDEFKAARHKLGLTQSELARILNTAPQTVRKWEMPAANSTARLVNPIAAQVMRWMLDGFRPPEFPTD